MRISESVQGGFRIISWVLFVPELSPRERSIAAIPTAEPTPKLGKQCASPKIEEPKLVRIEPKELVTASGISQA